MSAFRIPAWGSAMKRTKTQLELEDQSASNATEQIESPDDPNEQEDNTQATPTARYPAKPMTIPGVKRVLAPPGAGGRIYDKPPTGDALVEYLHIREQVRILQKRQKEIMLEARSRGAPAPPTTKPKA